MCCRDGNYTISWSALWPRTTKRDVLAWIRGHQYGRGDNFGTTMVNENKALPRKRRRGPTKMNGGKTYAFSWLATSWGKTLTLLKPSVGKGIKWGSGEPAHPVWPLESSAIKSKVCGPKRFSNSFHSSGASMQSLTDKMWERASGWLRGEGTNCKQRGIFWARRVWNNSWHCSALENGVRKGGKLNYLILWNKESLKDGIRQKTQNLILVWGTGFGEANKVSKVSQNWTHNKSSSLSKLKTGTPERILKILA